MSAGSYPTMASSTVAASVTVRVIGPVVSLFHLLPRPYITNAYCCAERYVHRSRTRVRTYMGAEFSSTLFIHFSHFKCPPSYRTPKASVPPGCLLLNHARNRPVEANFVDSCCPSLVEKPQLPRPTEAPTQGRPERIDGRRTWQGRRRNGRSGQERGAGQQPRNGRPVLLWSCRCQYQAPPSIGLRKLRLSYPRSTLLTCTPPLMFVYYISTSFFLHPSPPGD